MVGRSVQILVESVEVVRVLQEVVMTEKQILEVVVAALELAAPEEMVVLVSLLFAINTQKENQSRSQSQNQSQSKS